MKHFFLTILGALLVSIIFSQNVDKKVAVVAGTNFMLDHQAVSNKNIDYKKQTIKTVSIQGEDAYHIINFEDGAFVIVSASFNSIPVIGYSYEGTYNTDNISDAQQSWMQAMGQDIIENKQIKGKQNILDQWSYYLHENFTPTKTKSKGVTPLNNLRWGQSYPYNAYCPEHSSGSNGRCVTGCVATAMGMVMKHWDYPATGQGQKTYFWGDYYTVHFDSTTYEWQNMSNYATSTNYQATALLLFHCGVSCNMNYGPSGSGTQTTYAADALKQYFDYIPTLDFYEKRDYSEYDWKFMLKEELDYGRPIIYSGYDDNYAGHAFVCDGYQDTMYFHFNWGWNGSGNGYFSLNAGSPNTITYQYGQDAILGIMPPAEEFCSSIEYTQDYWEFDDGSNYSWYQNNRSCQWLINPVSGGPIRLSFSQFKTEDNKDILYIYDGANANANLIGSYSGNQIPSAITSSGDELFLRFETDNSTQMEGWTAYYTTQTQSIEDVQEEISITAYPQPCNQSISIDFNTFTNETIALDVYNNNGSLVYQEAIESISGKNNISLDVSAWKSGLYIVHLNSEHYYASKKLSVIH